MVLSKTMATVRERRRRFDYLLREARTRLAKKKAIFVTQKITSNQYVDVTSLRKR